MDNRIRLLQHHRIDKFVAFAPEIPLIVVALEEHPGLINPAKSEDKVDKRYNGKKLRPKIERAVGRLLKEVAKIGILVTLVAQHISADALDTDGHAQFSHRISLRVDNPGSVQMVHQECSVSVT